MIVYVRCDEWLPAASYQYQYQYYADDGRKSGVPVPSESSPPNQALIRSFPSHNYSDGGGDVYQDERRCQYGVVATMMWYDDVVALGISSDGAEWKAT